MSLTISAGVTPVLAPEIATNFCTPTSCLDRLPPEVLAQITCYIDGYDICTLYMCGSRRVINSMEARGGVKSFELDVSDQPRPCFPTIASRLRQLTSFALLAIPSTMIDGVDITLLPPTLTRLELQFSNGLSSLFILPHTDPSSKIRLHDLKSLFPGLRTLKYPLLPLRARQLFSVLPPTIENYTWKSFSSKPKMSKLPRSLIHLDLQIISRALQESVWDEESWCMPPDLASLAITLESFTDTSTSMLFQHLPTSLTSLTISIPHTDLEPSALWPPKLTSLTLRLRMGVPFTSTAIQQLPRSLTQFTSHSPSLEPEAVLTLPQNLTTFSARFTKDSDSWIPPPTTEDDLKTSDTLLGRFGKDDVGHRAILRRLPRSLTKIGPALQEMADRVGYYALLPEGLVDLLFRRATDVDLSILPSSLTLLSLESNLLHYGAIDEQLGHRDALASTKFLWERFGVLESLRLGAGCRSHSLIISDVAQACPALLKLSLALSTTQPTSEAIQVEQAKMDQLFSVLPSRLRSLEMMLQSRPIGSFKHYPTQSHKLTSLMLHGADSVRTTSEAWKSLPPTLHTIRIVISHLRECWEPKHVVPAITKKPKVRTALQKVDRSSSRAQDVDPSPIQGTGKTHLEQSEPMIPRDSASIMLASIFQTCTNLKLLDIHLCPKCEIINEYQLSHAKCCTALRELSLDSSSTMLSLNIFDLLPSKLFYLSLPNCHPIAEASYPVLKGRLPQLRGITVGNRTPDWFAKEDLSVHRHKMAQLYKSISDERFGPEINL